MKQIKPRALLYFAPARLCGRSIKAKRGLMKHILLHILWFISFGLDQHCDKHNCLLSLEMVAPSCSGLVCIKCDIERFNKQRQEK